MDDDAYVLNLARFAGDYTSNQQDGWTIIIINTSNFRRKFENIWTITVPIYTHKQHPTSAYGRFNVIGFL